MNINAKTDREILDRLARAAKLPLPDREQRRQQKRSWIIAEAGMGSDADEAAYAVALVNNDQGALVRLNREAEARMDYAKAYLAGVEL